MKYLFLASEGISHGPHTSECTTSNIDLNLIFTYGLNGLLDCFPIKQTSQDLSGKLMIGIPVTMCFDPS
ncbi:hypothetical protein Lalb_Chr01g0015321 [Lupinus albus]|uniref:Uncharacterized protein n=1 Tax=Lupinus albus TaxID=3870 RepID=A0A6A4R5Y1_LUPAL|nr:hypothetical protein Lalb_Chr01g0015321 [Lupinus albus]